MTQFLVVDDERAVRWKLVAGIEAAELGQAHEAADLESARAMLRGGRYDLVLLDLGLPPGGDDPLPSPDAGLTLLDEIAADPGAGPDVLVVTAEASVEIAVEAMKRGAIDYLQKPFDAVELRRRLTNALAARANRDDLRALREVVERASGLDAVVFEAPQMEAVLRQARKVARTASTVLVRGETGTGKELIARTLHFASPRREGPFVVVDTPAIPSTLLESELFGHLRGAFTGARAARKGKFELARGGTIFLDEIGDMGLELQAKVLRVIEEREFQPLGASVPIAAEVRIVAATHQDLEGAVESGGFRRDLYYRLNVVPITIPPLRGRAQDIPLLARHFLTRFNRELGTRVAGFEDAALERLVAERWPGNVRQLKNLVERLANLVEDDTLIGIDDLEAALEERRPGTQAPKGAAAGPADDPFPPLEGTLADCVEQLEKVLVRRAMIACRGNKSAAASRLGLSRPALYSRLDRYGIQD